MTRIPRTLLSLIAAVAAAVAAVAAATPALGQIDPGDLGRLEQRRDEITAELAGLDVRLTEVALEVAALEDTVGVREVQIELVADQIERTVHDRREPASTRVEMAIVGYTQGDPRQNALLDEIRTLEGDDEPARRRVLYESVIEDTNARLAAIDERLGGLADQLTIARRARSDTEALLSASEEELAEVGHARSQLAIALQEVLNRIERLRALENRSVLTGLSTFEDPSRPVLAVKIDNVPGARPQAGINQADIVFVEEVEGGLTRLAAIFHSGGAEVVGPVRSMRTGDFDLLAQFNGPLFANSGGNRGTVGALADSTLVDVGVREEFDSYYRITSRRAPHNLFTNAYNLWVVGRGREGTGTPSPIFFFRSPGDSLPAGATAARRVDIDYGSTIVTYEWNGTGWDRSQDNAPTVDTEGVRTSPTTVIVQFIAYGTSAADARSPEAVTIDVGKVWILTEGNIVQANWRRNSLEEQFAYIDDQGNHIEILPGRTWIELPRPDSATRS